MALHWQTQMFSQALELVDQLLVSFNVQVLTTGRGAHFFNTAALEAKGVRVWTDEDEWGAWSKRGDPVTHIELRRWKPHNDCITSRTHSIDTSSRRHYTLRCGGRGHRNLIIASSCAQTQYAIKHKKALVSRLPKRSTFNDRSASDFLFVQRCSSSADQQCPLCRWAHVLLIAPLSANTLAKLATVGRPILLLNPVP